MAKYKFDKSYVCQKCGYTNDYDSRRQENFIPAKTHLNGIGQTIVDAPESIQINCGRCQYTVVNLDPLDFVPPPVVP